MFCVQEEDDIKNNPGTENFILKRPFGFMSNLENEFVPSVPNDLGLRYPEFITRKVSASTVCVMTIVMAYCT